MRPRFEPAEASEFELRNGGKKKNHGLVMPSFSRQTTGRANAGSMGSTSHFPSSERPAMPKKVWKTSATSSGRSAKPPDSASWHWRMNAASLSRSIQSMRPSSARLASTHHEQHTSGSFSGRPLRPPEGSTWRSASHHARRSASRMQWSRAPAISSAATQQNICPAWVSASGTAPQPPSKFLQRSMNATALATSTASVRPRILRLASAHRLKRVSTSPHSSPAKLPSARCSRCTNATTPARAAESGGSTASRLSASTSSCSAESVQRRCASWPTLPPKPPVRASRQRVTKSATRVISQGRSGRSRRSAPRPQYIPDTRRCSVVQYSISSTLRVSSSVTNLSCLSRSSVVDSPITRAHTHTKKKREVKRSDDNDDFCFCCGEKAACAADHAAGNRVSRRADDARGDADFHADKHERILCGVQGQNDRAAQVQRAAPRGACVPQRKSRHHRCAFAFVGRRRGSDIDVGQVSDPQRGDDCADVPAGALGQRKDKPRHCHQAEAWHRPRAHNCFGCSASSSSCSDGLRCTAAKKGCSPSCCRTSSSSSSSRTECGRHIGAFVVCDERVLPERNHHSRHCACCASNGRGFCCCTTARAAAAATTTTEADSRGGGADSSTCNTGRGAEEGCCADPRPVCRARQSACTGGGAEPRDRRAALCRTRRGKKQADWRWRSGRRWQRWHTLPDRGPCDSDRCHHPRGVRQALMKNLPLDTTFFPRGKRRFEDLFGEEKTEQSQCSNNNEARLSA